MSELLEQAKLAREAQERADTARGISDKPVTLLRDMQEFENQIRDKADTWEVFTLADAYAPRDPLQYIIGGLFTLPSLSIVYGAPGTLKSLLLADAMMHVAAGMPWLGRPVIQAPVLWIDCDNGKRRTHERNSALALHLNLPPDAPFFYTSMPNPQLDAGNLEDIKTLERRISSRGIRFVMMDNLTLISPNTDEGSDGMAKVMGNLRILSEETGAATTAIHHQRKSQSNSARVGETLRGHSSIEASLDLALLVEREPEDSNIITIRSTKTRDVDVWKFGAEFRYEHKPGTEELLKCTFAAYEMEDTTSDKALEKAVIEVIKSAPGINQSDLKTRVKSVWQGGEKLVFLMTERLEKKRVIKTALGAHGAKLHYVV